MEKYLNKRGISPITHFQIEDVRIIVWFEKRIEPYYYSYKKAGAYHVEQMKILAREGSGLCKYITIHVKSLND